MNGKSVRGEQTETRSLDAGRLRQAAGSLLADVVVLAETPSSNDWAMTQARRGRALPFACFAERQTRGRGRRGKAWLHAEGGGIAMSLAWPFTLSPGELSRLPLALALAVSDALTALGLAHCAVKWPNDVLVDGRKIAGILLETCAAPGLSPRSSPSLSSQPSMVAVIGIGLNYDLASLRQNDNLPTQAITAYRQALRRWQPARQPATREQLAAALLRQCAQCCQQWPRQADACLQRFQPPLDWLYGKAVAVTNGQGDVVHGVARGVGAHGELRVMCEAGEKRFYSAEVSVRASGAMA